MTRPTFQAIRAPRSHGSLPRWLWQTALWIGLGVAPAAAATEAQRQALREGLTAAQEGVALLRDNSDAARLKLRAAADVFEGLLADGLENPALEFNLGNAYYRLDDVGRAVLHYRRALRLSPGDPRIRQNLSLARQRVTPTIAPPGERQMLRQLFFWHFSTTLRSRFVVALFLSVLGWGLLLAWLRWRRWVLAILGTVIALHGLGAGASVVGQLYAERAAPPAVIIAGEHVLQLGRGAGQDEALSQPLGPGIELRILQERAGWFEVRLRDGQRGWLLADGIERVLGAVAVPVTR